MKPRKRGAIHAEPHRLTDDYIGIGRDRIREPFVKEVNDGQDCACERHEAKNEKSPARPNIGKCVVNDVIQTAPADGDEYQCRDAEGLEFNLLIH